MAHLTPLAPEVPVDVKTNLHKPKKPRKWKVEQITKYTTWVGRDYVRRWSIDRIRWDWVRNRDEDNLEALRYQEILHVIRKKYDMPVSDHFISHGNVIAARLRLTQGVVRRKNNRRCDRCKRNIEHHHDLIRFGCWQQRQSGRPCAGSISRGEGKTCSLAVKVTPDTVEVTNRKGFEDAKDAGRALASWDMFKPILKRKCLDVEVKVFDKQMKELIAGVDSVSNLNAPRGSTGTKRRRLDPAKEEDGGDEEDEGEDEDEDEDEDGAGNGDD
ncbi:hypothetical protein Q5752_003674 [Cryptotrichosporon argae]